MPIATVGGADAMSVLIRGERLSMALRLDKMLRLKLFPFAMSLPWGIVPAALPQFPLPASGPYRCSVRTKARRPKSGGGWGGGFQ
jgi:hypothetical protein